MATVTLTCAAVIVVCSLALAYHGWHTIIGQHDAVLQLAGRIVTTAAAYGQRRSASDGTVVVRFAVPENLYVTGARWLVMAEASSGGVRPPVAVVSRPQAGSIVELEFDLHEPGRAEVSVELSVLDLETLEPLARFGATVPAVKGPPLLRRVVSAVHQALKRSPRAER